MKNSNFICEHGDSKVLQKKNNFSNSNEKCKFCDIKCDSGRIINIGCGCELPEKTKAHEKCAKNWFCYLDKQCQLPDAKEPQCFCDVCGRRCRGILNIMVKKQSGKWVTRNELMDKKNKQARWGCGLF